MNNTLLSADNHLVQKWIVHMVILDAVTITFTFENGTYFEIVLQYVKCVKYFCFCIVLLA